MFGFVLRISLAAIVFFGSVSTSQADLLQPSLSPVRFYAVDDYDPTDPLSINDWVTLSFSGFGDIHKVEYSLNQTSWLSVTGGAIASSGSVNIYTGPDNWELVYFRHIGSLTPDIADVNFVGSGGPNLWNTAVIMWADLGLPGFVLVVADNDDDVSPVPVPHTFLLLGTGLIGFIFFKRKKNGALRERTAPRIFS